jgi:poly-gamma-glutamate capsule biosynthesis protein CapA/YwtB (metallophosphatase superfamily)
MTTAPAPLSAARVLFGGDVMTGRGIDQILATPLPATLFEPEVQNARRYVRRAERINGPIPLRNPPEYVWGDGLEELTRLEPDLRIVNLGTAITSTSTPWAGKGEHYRMSPRHIGCLKVAAIDACSLANGHVLDWDYPGLRETLAVLREAGIAGAGAGLEAAQAQEPVGLALPGGGRLLLFSWATSGSGVPAGWGASTSRPGIALLPGLGDADAREVRDCVGRWRRPGDLIVISLHWGSRWLRQVPAEHREFAQRLIELDAADVIHGHSPQAPLPIEVYRGKLILHACGDLINDCEGVPAPDGLRIDTACLYAATLSRDDGRLVSLEIVPLQRRHFRLCRPTSQAHRWLLDRLDEGGAALGTAIDLWDSGRWHLDWRA